MYAIKNKRTGKWVFGTWYQDGRQVQRTDHEWAMIFPDREMAENEMQFRKCGKDYVVVKVQMMEVEA